MKVKNGILKGELKVRNGKLVRCFIELKKEKIKKIKISGDFFMHPEEKIEEIEKNLKGVEFQEGEIRKKLIETLKNVQLIGIDIEDFVKVIINSKPS